MDLFKITVFGTKFFQKIVGTQGPIPFRPSCLGLEAVIVMERDQGQDINFIEEEEICLLINKLS